MNWQELHSRFLKLAEFTGREKSSSYNISMSFTGEGEIFVQMGTYDIPSWPRHTEVGLFKTEEEAYKATEKKIEEAEVALFDVSPNVRKIIIHERFAEFETIGQIKTELEKMNTDEFGKIFRVSLKETSPMSLELAKKDVIEELGYLPQNLVMTFLRRHLPIEYFTMG